MRTRIKICGVTQSDDLKYAVSLGVDAIGLVFQPQSPRCLSIQQARSVIEDKPPFVSIIALFADASEQTVRDVIAAVKIDCLQFHGEEPEDFCVVFGMPYLKAVPMGSLQNPDAYIRRYADSAAGVVLDSHQLGQCGGSGKTFNWEKITGDYHLPIIIAGGLTAENVGASIRQIRPYGVDVASGVESDKGIKDNKRMSEFVAAVHAADKSLACADYHPDA